MMTVKTKIDKSSIHGIGLFADEFIPKGTKIWEFTPGFDLKFTPEQIKELPKAVQEYLGIYAWLSKKSGMYCFSSDNGKYFNHSKNNNVQSYYLEGHHEVITYALRDIKKGKELLDDYNSFEEGFKEYKL
ncbi:MAG: SET domain-containing protein [Candidatus Paceibacterota bacterium]